jgi:hypothetical protein
MKNKQQIAALKKVCPMPVLLAKLGLEAHARSSCKSPLREDNKASWGIFQRNGAWFFKDHSTGESGDEITFLCLLLNLDPKKQFLEIVEAYQKITSAPCNVTATPQIHHEKPQDRFPDRSGYALGTSQQLETLSKLRGYDIEALRIASAKGVLVFGSFGGHEVFGVTDSSGRSFELRRLDGKVFPSSLNLSERKSHTVRYSSKSWPVGLPEASDASTILICEGVPDFLAAWQIIHTEGKLSSVAPVTMLGAANRIGTEALPSFKGKHVRIVPHQDVAGFKAAKLWQQQLLDVGASCVDFVDLGRFASADHKIKDLDDFKTLHTALNREGTTEGRIL